jgi:hypothetical protein
VEASCEGGNKPSGSIKRWEVLVAAQLAASQEGLSSSSILPKKTREVHFTTSLSIFSVAIL